MSKIQIMNLVCWSLEAILFAYESVHVINGIKIYQSELCSILTLKLSTLVEL